MTQQIASKASASKTNGSQLALDRNMAWKWGPPNLQSHHAKCTLAVLNSTFHLDTVARLKENVQMTSGSNQGAHTKTVCHSNS